ncbi:hypothetical protein ACSLOU_00565 [Enterobacter cloacae]|uniref:hypothetical protein n=1 Tax=Enterobacter cloacae TaxID=550 RepID=UPI003EDEBE1E
MINDITAGVEFSQELSVTCVQPDDGTYAYSWSLQAGVTGLSLVGGTTANPTLQAAAPAAGTAYLDLQVTDSSGKKVSMAEKSITVGAATLEGTQTEAPQMVQSHYNAVQAPTAPKKTRKTK